MSSLSFHSTAVWRFPSQKEKNWAPLLIITSLTYLSIHKMPRKYYLHDLSSNPNGHSVHNKPLSQNLFPPPSYKKQDCSTTRLHAKIKRDQATSGLHPSIHTYNNSDNHTVVSASIDLSEGEKDSQARAARFSGTHSPAYITTYLPTIQSQLTDSSIYSNWQYRIRLFPEVVEKYCEAKRSKGRHSKEGGGRGLM